jgi:hypothetical protein
MAFSGTYPRLTPAGIDPRATDRSQIGQHADAVERQITTMHSANAHRTSDSEH